VCYPLHLPLPTLGVGAVLQFGCEFVPPPPAEALDRVERVAAGYLGYTLAWKASPVNRLVMWGTDDQGNDIIATLKASLPNGGDIANVVQLSATRLHALVLKADGTVVAGYIPDMKDFALPPKGPGRILRVSAGYGFSLGVRGAA
jgi:hypothetical protein